MPSTTTTITDWQLGAQRKKHFAEMSRRMREAWRRGDMNDVAMAAGEIQFMTGDPSAWLASRGAVLAAQYGISG